jgi:hypothetical protein
MTPSNGCFEQWLTFVGPLNLLVLELDLGIANAFEIPSSTLCGTKPHGQLLLVYKSTGLTTVSRFTGRMSEP